MLCADDGLELDFFEHDVVVTDTGTQAIAHKHDGVETYVVVVNGKEIQLSSDPMVGTGGLLWPAGEALAMFLSTLEPAALRDRKVLELGSGTGIVGLSVALTMQLGHGRVTLTDMKQVLPVLDRNVHLNGTPNSVDIHALEWGDDVPEHLQDYDVLLLADCVYLEALFEPLISTLQELMIKDSVVAYMAYKKRRKADARFFKMLRKRFLVMEMEKPKDGIYLYCIKRKI